MYMDRRHVVWLMSLESTSSPLQPQALELKRFFHQPAFALHSNNVENQAKFSRLEAPYTSECISEWSSTNYSTFTGDKSWTYTEEVAILCFLFASWRNCIFSHPYIFWGPFSRNLTLANLFLDKMLLKVSLVSFQGKLLLIQWNMKPNISLGHLFAV